MNIEDYKGVFVFVEQVDNVVSNVGLELIGKASDLAQQIGTKVTAVLLGKNIESEYKKLGAYGADVVVGVAHPMLEIYKTEPYTHVLAELIKEYKPEIFLFGATAQGRDLAPRVSSRVQTGLTADCTVLEIEEETNHLLATRPAFGGNVMATIICPKHRPQMATVRPGVMEMRPYDESRPFELIQKEIDIPASCDNVEILEVVKTKSTSADIQEAPILVSGGRGVGGKEGFALLEQVASKLGGMVSASRACTDENWIEKDRQVGQTGKTVRPKLYIACGISGAIQHVAGMEESELIVAINKDETASIFDVADIGLVGDLHKILPAFLEELSKTEHANSALK